MYVGAVALHVPGSATSRERYAAVPSAVGGVRLVTGLGSGDRRRREEREQQAGEHDDDARHRASVGRIPGQSPE